MKRQLLRAGMLGLLASGVLSLSAWSQSDPTGKKRVTNTYAITDATVFTSPGQKGTKATVLFRDGVIIDIGPGLTLPVNAKQIAGDSLYIYPGFIAGAGSMGITKPNDPERPEDLVSSDPPDEIAGITPWRSASEQFSITDNQVDEWRKAGFTIAQILPDGGMIPGKADLVILGQSGSTNILQSRTALAANFRGTRGMYPSTAAGVMAKFRDLYQNSTLALERSKVFASNSAAGRPELNPTYQSMAAVVQKQIPVIFTASSDLEARRAIALQKELDFKLVLAGLERYEPVIDLLKSTKTPVLIKLEIPDDKAIKAQKDSVDQSIQALYDRVKQAYDEALKQAALLEKAGVPFGFSTVGSKAGDSRKALRTLVKNGLGEQAALAALTTNPASILGIDRLAGTIEKGKLANLTISTGPIFEEKSQIKYVVADGYLFEYDTKKKSEDKDGETKIEGTWEYSSKTPSGSSSGKLMFSKEESGYSGTIFYDDPSGKGSTSSPLKNISVSGNSISFKFELNASGVKLPISVSGVINGDMLEGGFSIPKMGSYPVKATRINPSPDSLKKT